MAAQQISNIEDGIKGWLATKARTIPTPRVVVFIHGGMNPYSTTKNRIEDTNLLSALTNDNCYPIFVSWNSGPFSSYAEHLVSIRQGEKCSDLLGAGRAAGWVIGSITAPAVLASDLAKGLARLPVTLTGRFFSDYKTTELPVDSPKWLRLIGIEWLQRELDFDRTARWEGFEKLINTNLPSYHPPAPEGNNRTWTERNVRMTEYVLSVPTKIATLGILDGLGTEAWDIMLRRSHTMFEPPAVYDVKTHLDQFHTNSAEVRKWLNGQDGGMTSFTIALKDWTQNDATNSSHPNGGTNFFSKRVDFEFYGHSMGAIVLNELFSSPPATNIITSKIVYLGAACSIHDFEAAMFPYLRVHMNTDFYSLSLHRTRERDENALASAGIVFPVFRDLIVRGSLLNWIDDIFAKPKTISDRTLGAWENITRALPDIPKDLRPQIHLRGCDVEKLSVLSQLTGTNEPQVHGDFPMAIFWRENFYWPSDGTNHLRLLKPEPRFKD